jgi:hypothetical protein
MCMAGWQLGTTHVNEGSRYAVFMSSQAAKRIDHEVCVAMSSTHGQQRCCGSQNTAVDILYPARMIAADWDSRSGAGLGGCCAPRRPPGFCAGTAHGRQGPETREVVATQFPRPSIHEKAEVRQSQGSSAHTISKCKYSLAGKKLRAAPADKSNHRFPNDSNTQQPRAATRQHTAAADGTEPTTCCSQHEGLKA